MPPVRWKTLCIAVLMLHQGWVVTNGQEMQDAISMTSDGWRPIIGARIRQTPTYSETEISKYKNPNQKVEFDVVKSENPVSFSSTVPPRKFGDTTNSINNVKGVTVHSSSQGGKILPHSKPPPPPAYHTLPTSQPPPHRHQIQGRPSQFGFRNHLQKLEMHHSKRKPPRGPAMAHSNREEVFVHAPINLPYLKLGPSNVKTRETQGLGFLGKNHFTVNQPNSHIEINRFPHPPTNDDVFEQFKSQSLVFPKLKNQQDEYTRNLVPPPPNRHLAEKEKLKSAKIPAHLKDNVATVSEPVIEFHDFGLQGFVQNKPQIQENLVQFSAPYEQSLDAFHKQFRPKEPPIDVQVTKEKVKEWQNTLPNRVNPKVPDYVDYDFHSLNNQGHLTKLQTYEVTEGKWADNPNPYTFVYHQPQLQHKPPSGNSARPQLIAEPIVELNVPPFLPTPYRPEGPFPTSSTHSEASTVFSLVTQKMNKYKNEALTNNPLFFDIKEVSTHYPILGQPAFTQESQTDTSLPMSEVGEISNEITTQRAKTRRRRPQPRRPTTTTTTPSPPSTTTEDAESTESYDFQKVQEPLDASSSAETERPRRRKRPRIPSRGRYDNSASGSTETEERPLRYRTTTTPTYDVDEGEEKKTRNRYRYRTRGNKDGNEIRNVNVRKRTRPTTTETPANHKMLQEDSSSMSEEDSREPVRVFQGAYQSRYPQQEADNESTTKSARQPVRIRYKMHDDVSVETPSMVVIEEVTNKIQLVEELTEEAVSPTTTEGIIVNINPPENEIDYTTASTSSPDQPDVEAEAQTTLATTIPTTTAAAAEEQQTVRTGGKTRNRPPIKYSAGRPRFSVKDYRQRLNQYTSTTPSTTTDFVRTTSERLRFPNRLRSRPTHSTTSPTLYDEEEQSTDQIQRRKFVPKEPRHGYPSASTESSNVIAEKRVKAVNTRLRPFGQHRDGGGNGAATSGAEHNGLRTSNGSLYSRKRPTALRSKYFGKPERNATTETPVTEEVSEAATTTTEKEDLPVESDTEYETHRTTSEVPPSTTEDLDQDDYSQRVSDLTSSFKTEYDTPGLFKSVSPNSRRVPNYFTISTDDPILPIEAFFPNIKDREQ